MRADAVRGQRTLARAAVALVALMGWSAVASAAAPPPITIDCPAQSVGNRMPTAFVWDGAEFKQVRKDGRTFARKVTAAKEIRREIERAQSRLITLQLAPTPGEASPERRDYVALELAPEPGKDTASLYFKMTTLDAGFLTDTLLQHSQGCTVSSR